MAGISAGMNEEEIERLVDELFIDETHSVVLVDRDVPFTVPEGFGFVGVEPLLPELSPRDVYLWPREVLGKHPPKWAEAFSFNLVDNLTVGLAQDVRDDWAQSLRSYVEGYVPRSVILKQTDNGVEIYQKLRLDLPWDEEARGVVIHLESGSGAPALVHRQPGPWSRWYETHVLGEALPENHRTAYLNAVGAWILEGVLGTPGRLNFRDKIAQIKRMVSGTGGSAGEPSLGERPSVLQEPYQDKHLVVAGDAQSQKAHYRGTYVGSMWLEKNGFFRFEVLVPPSIQKDPGAFRNILTALHEQAKAEAKSHGYRVLGLIDQWGKDSESLRVFQAHRAHGRTRENAAKATEPYEVAALLGYSVVRELRPYQNGGVQAAFVAPGDVKAHVTLDLGTQPTPPVTEPVLHKSEDRKTLDSLIQKDADLLNPTPLVMQIVSPLSPSRLKNGFGPRAKNNYNATDYVKDNWPETSFVEGTTDPQIVQEKLEWFDGDAWVYTVVAPSMRAIDLSRVAPEDGVDLGLHPGQRILVADGIPRENIASWVRVTPHKAPTGAASPDFVAQDHGPAFLTRVDQQLSETLLSLGLNLKGEMPRWGEKLDRLGATETLSYELTTPVTPGQSGFAHVFVWQKTKKQRLGHAWVDENNVMHLESIVHVGTQDTKGKQDLNLRGAQHAG